MARVNTISKTVTTAGTAEALSDSDLWVSWFQLEFKSANGGTNVYRGATSSVDSNYPVITADKAYIWAIAGQNQNLKEWYIDVDTNGDGVWITYGVAQSDVNDDIPS